MQIKAIIFDCGRVFLDDPDNEIIFNDMATSCGLSKEFVAEVVTSLLPSYQKGELTDEMFWREFSKRTRIKCLPKNYHELWTRAYLPLTKINTKIIALAKKLHQRGYFTPVCSNTIPPHVRVNRARNLFEHFQPEIFSCEVGCRKPDSKIYFLAAERTGVKPEECIFIDDVLEYVKAAQAIGMKCIQYQNLTLLEKELRKYGVLI